MGDDGAQKPPARPASARLVSLVSSPVAAFTGWLARIRAEDDPEDAPESEKTAEFIEETARWVTGRKLEVPAVLFLEAHKPVASLAGQALIFASPFAAPLFGRERMERLQELCRSADHVDRLIERIEALSGSPELGDRDESPPRKAGPTTDPKRPAAPPEGSASRPDSHSEG